MICNRFRHVSQTLLRWTNFLTMIVSKNMFYQLGTCFYVILWVFFASLRVFLKILKEKSCLFEVRSNFFASLVTTVLAKISMCLNNWNALLEDQFSCAWTKIGTLHLPSYAQNSIIQKTNNFLKSTIFSRKNRIFLFNDSICNLRYDHENIFYYFCPSAAELNI